MRKLLLLPVLTALALFSNAQDPHFSQFFASPLTLNPALTGKFDGNLRIAGNHRNQWPTISRAFSTQSLSLDFPILQNALPDNDRWGVGASFVNDQQADGVIRSMYYGVSTAYHKGLDEDGFHQVSVGFQGSYTQKRLDISNVKFEDQLRSDGFTGITNEIFANQVINVNYFDLNAGLLFSGIIGDATNYYGGASMYHILRPTESFRGGQFILNPRYTVHGGVYMPIGARTMLHTSALYQNQGRANEFVFGGAFGLNVNDDMEYNPTNFYVGAWMRVNDAIAPYVGLEWNKFRLGMTYDVNVSSLKTVSNSRGGFEISLIFINKPSDEKGISCPKF